MTAGYDDFNPISRPHSRSAFLPIFVVPGGRLSEQKKKRNLWKTLPGFVISAFFLWRTLTGIHYQTIESIRFVNRWWFAVLAAALVTGYTVRVYRWWLMLRANGAPGFSVCARVLLTSFAANNVLPFRIGDFLRVFGYAEELGSSSSSILGTVILERLLDMFMLLSFLTAAVATSTHILTFPMFGHDVRILSFALPVLAVVTLGVAAFLLFARQMETLVRGLVGALPAGKFVDKAESWILLAFDSVKKLSLSAKMMLLVASFAAWFCEGIIFVSASRVMGLVVGARGPWLALSLSNLSYLIPSAPGAIGTFEYFCKLGMVSQGGKPDLAAVYGLFVHVIVLLTITLAGGIAFFMHRAGRARAIARADMAEVASERKIPVRN